ncbi:hypothetical protein FRB91_000331 [Serendipita sp. 411]|nr:hypothetical protein FRC18_000886 [Serendipita sp. 400]KAG8846940.1 hypothetical protein FRB91_000331 [Serendipita sp. 411]
MYLTHDAFVCIIRDHTFDKATLCSLSLVSRSLCAIAQRALFHEVVLMQFSNDPEDHDSISEDAPFPFRWPKLEFLAQSEKVLQYVHDLSIIFVHGENIPTSMLDGYWHGTSGRPVLDSLDRLLPSCLDRMSSLEIFQYAGPSLRAPIHQAILRQKSMKILSTSVKTHCSSLCKEALCTPESTTIHELNLMEQGNDMQAFGGFAMNSCPIGPRRCAFLSHMVLTCSSSLRVLRISFPLLYDALRPSSPCSFPDFPHLSSLYLVSSHFICYGLEQLSAMSAVVVSFIFHVHATIKILEWGCVLEEKWTKAITASHFPKLETLSGTGIRHGTGICHLIQTHSPRTVRITDLCSSNFDPDIDWSLLREVSSRLPNLATLAISTKIRLTAIPRDISKFTNVVELWYHEQPYCSPGDEESENCNDYVPLFIRIILPALPKLQRLCITVDLDDSSVPAFKLPSAAILSSSRSLCSLTIQFVREATGDYRFDAYRDDLESDWVSNILEGAEYIRHFSF